MRSRTAKPASKPIVAGITAILPLSAHISMLGISRDQTDAAIMIPDAKPISPFWTFWLISFLITNTKAEPKAVPRKGISSEVMTIGVESDILKRSDAFDFNHCILREGLHCEGAACWERSFKIF